MAELHEDELVCPRCDEMMERGFLNAGKGPFRWVERIAQHATIWGGERVARRPHPFWGRLVVTAARCPRCRVGVFAYDPA